MKPVVHFARDTSINLQNAYSRLMLDSASVERFLNNEVQEENFATNIRSFYNSRNYQFAWFNEQGITEQCQAFWSLHQMRVDRLNDSALYSRKLHQTMELLLDEDTTISADDLQDTELRITLHFFKYLNNAFQGKVRPEDMQWHIPKRKIDEQALIDSFVAGKIDWRPLHQSFYKLQTKLMQYALIARDGGWPHIEMKKKTIRKGEANAVIAQIKKRLKITGDFSQADTSHVFDDSLRNSIIRMQRSYGLKETGFIDAALVKELNVGVDERIVQMKINLERMRWLPEEEPNRIVANIPEYKLHVFEQGKEVFNMDIVVGKAANRTVIFSDQLQYIVFSPYWNIPKSIIRNEILPAMNGTDNYLSKNNMEITGYSNELPVVRQKPGRGNALGKVKFIFPNRYNIYFHDTPAKTLFNKQKRAFSHGCIRLQKPFSLAKYLLRNDELWTDKKIRAAMNKNIEKWIKLAQPIPVYIVYLTSWVDATGLVHFRHDVYGHDERMFDHLFQQ